MKKGMITIYTGDSGVKSPVALGRAILSAAAGESVVIIQFLKGKGLEDSAFVKKMEPEIKLFRFEKSDENFEKLSEEKKEDEIKNIKNGINFAKKVLSTGECNLLILDEILGLLDKKIISVEDLENLISLRNETNVILTGVSLNDEVCILADEVSKIETMKFKTYKIKE